MQGYRWVGFIPFSFHEGALVVGRGRFVFGDTLFETHKAAYDDMLHEARTKGLEHMRRDNDYFSDASVSVVDEVQGTCSVLYELVGEDGEILVAQYTVFHT